MYKKHKNTTGIPDFELDAFARALLPAIQEFFSIDKNQKEYEDWLATRKMEKKTKAHK